MSDTGFVLRGSTTAFDGYLVDIVQMELEVPDGSVVTREVARHPGAVAIVALDADSFVLLERQYRAALDANVLEIPAGKRDVVDEPPLQTARRELIEETGYDAATWVELGAFYNSPGFTDEHTTLFLATELSYVGADLKGPEEEAMELIHLPMSEALDLVASGELSDAKSMLGLFLAAQYMDR